MRTHMVVAVVIVINRLLSPSRAHVKLGLTPLCVTTLARWAGLGWMGACLNCVHVKKRGAGAGLAWWAGLSLGCVVHTLGLLCAGVD